jgi:hypothetical protein
MALDLGLVDRALLVRLPRLVRHVKLLLPGERGGLV